mmetsp:Transcript_8890/g.18956  ORF Transcript_8890/g.18956 Transcript_8890/m.18956 type:complete len:504 (-) Transcript_8890:134-1645(-)
MWLAFAYFHNGEYRKAMGLYDELMGKPGYDQALHVYKACCLYALCEYESAREEAEKGPYADGLKVRILFHVAHKLNDEQEMMKYHEHSPPEGLGDSIEDQLCLAAIQYLRAHYQDATDVYKRLLLENRDNLALNVYVAMCYYKLDYYDVGLEILQVYLAQEPTSVTAVNLKACSHYQLYNGKAAEAELKVLQNASTSGDIYQDHDLLRHNLVVFRNGENALQVLPHLMETIPEAKLNLILYYLRREEVTDAFALTKDLEPTVPREYILKGVVYAALGQQTGSLEHLKMAQQLFQLVGASASECDTIPGRQSMASCFMLLRQYEDVLVYLKSIKAYFPNDDDFNWNYGLACAAAHDYREAIEALLMVQSERYRSEFTYITWLARCYIMNNEPQRAWETYSRVETSNDTVNLLQLIANDCYKMGHFYFACKAFDVLERIDPDPEFSDGKRGAAIGVFQKVVAKQESTDKLQEVVRLLRNTNNPQTEYMVNRVIRKWAQENRVQLP